MQEHFIPVQLSHQGGAANDQPSIRTDWLEIFPEAKESYLLLKIEEIESSIMLLEKAAKKELERSRKLQDGWFIREMLKVSVITNIVNLKRELHRLKRYLPQTQTRDHVDQRRIDDAKQFPILEIAEAHIPRLRKCGRTWRALCPFHQEKTPSFVLYPESNVFHCYGCQQHGDVISLTQKLLSIDFIQAVKYLTPNYES